MSATTTELAYNVKRLRGQVVGWGLGLGGYAMLMIPAYNIIIENQKQMQEMLKAYPPEMAAFFGDMNAIATPAGFLQIYFFSMIPLFVGTFAAIAGSGLLARDEEAGVLDLVLAHPISRRALFVARALALLLAALGIHLAMWLGSLLGELRSSLDVSAGGHLLGQLSLFSMTALFLAAGVLSGVVLPARRLAGMATGLLVLGGYLLTSLSRLDDRLSGVAQLSPYTHFQGAITWDTFSWSSFGGLLGVAVLFFVLAFLALEKKEVRVGGEGTVKLRSLLPGRARRA